MNPFEPQLPSWLRANVPFRIDRDVIPLICGLDYLPENWARRKHLVEPSVKSVRIPVKGAPPFPPPHWTGDAPPTGVWVNQTINLPSYPETSEVDKNVLSNNPPKDFWLYLVRDLGFPIEAALTSFGTSPGIQTLDRRRRSAVMNEEEDEFEYESTFIAQPGHMYISVPIRHTKTGGGFTRNAVLDVVAGLRMPEKTKQAIFEVVALRMSPKLVSKKFGIKPGVLRVYATRIRQKIRAQNAKIPRNTEVLENELLTV